MNGHLKQKKFKWTLKSDFPTFIKCGSGESSCGMALIIMYNPFGDFFSLNKLYLATESLE